MNIVITRYSRDSLSMRLNELYIAFSSNIQVDIADRRFCIDFIESQITIYIYRLEAASGASANDIAPSVALLAQYFIDRNNRDGTVSSFRVP